MLCFDKFLMFSSQKLRNKFRSITLYHTLVHNVEFHTGALAGLIYPCCSNSLLSVTETEKGALLLNLPETLL